MQLVDWGIIGYEKFTWDDSPEDIRYHIRCWASGKLMISDPKDPDGKSQGRIVVPKAESWKILGYGEKGKIWIETAIKNL